ncbi:MAG TPA: T9SS type A sorting domain-containing protein, partial [Chitinophagaceae bacterium]|nr:T9SS type A sorting domain-containing protein [Chitinophagaceae bacterium]
NQYAVGGYSVFRGMPSSFVPPYTDPNLQPDINKNITAVLAGNPDVILVNYPTNSYDTLRSDSILYCLRTIRDSANKKGIPCFVTTTQPRSNPGNFSTSAVKRKLAVLKDSILLEFGKFAIDFYTGMYNPADTTMLGAYDSGDHVHFNGAGHDVLLQRVQAANVFTTSLLPATFLKYNASYNNNATLVTWSTAKEIDVDHYEIQRSTDGTSFTRLGDLTPNNGSGIYDYQYTDKQPVKGWNYYKIAIIDRDGKKQFSPVFKTFDNAGGLAVKRVINQSAQIILELQSNEAQNAGLQVINSTGLLVYKDNRHIDAGSSTLTINTGSLSSGIYYIKLVTAGKEPLITSFVKN